MVLNIVGNMQVRPESSKRQPLQEVHQQRAQVQQEVADVEQQLNREADAPETQKVTDIVGNTEDEEKDI
ncbi:MAG: hypothetical protein MJY52_04100 [Bacteroidaceae bacterium]|nr:hypothetical protein [Bacteroidaceae bacterium]